MVFTYSYFNSVSAYQSGVRFPDNWEIENFHLFHSGQPVEGHLPLIVGRTKRLKLNALGGHNQPAAMTHTRTGVGPVHCNLFVSFTGLPILLPTPLRLETSYGPLSF